ncbi:MAG: hypothetical protein ABIM89_11315 [Mycobacteriales bacterium]
MSAPDERLAAEILAHFTETASARFDDSLAAMPLDDVQRRELRFWQRQSLRALRQYAAGALPGALAAMSAAQQETNESLEAAAKAWAATQVAREPAAEESPVGAAGAVEPDHLELRRRTVAARLASGA